MISYIKSVFFSPLHQPDTDFKDLIGFLTESAILLQRPFGHHTPSEIDWKCLCTLPRGIKYHLPSFSIEITRYFSESSPVGIECFHPYAVTISARAHRKARNSSAESSGMAAAALVVMHLSYKAACAARW